jgi:UDP-hydrolysing UDP-N-acetyl-D-glucosamine 2-epimerase
LKRLVFVLGSRGEWGYIRPIIRLAPSYGFSPEIFATNTSIINSYGLLVDEIENEGFKVAHKALVAVDGDSHSSMVKSIGLMTLSFVDFLANNPATWTVVAGDRFEQMAAVLTSAFLYTPIAHIQAGERSGNIDGATRHAIARYAHLHFASNNDAAERLIKSGEESWRVHNTGAPQLDEVVALSEVDATEVLKKYQVTKDGYFLSCVHPVTEEYATTLDLVINLNQALQEIKVPAIWILPNNDSGGRGIRDYILSNKRVQDQVFRNITRIEYLQLLKNSLAIVGNSSSGILEAPSFAVPCLNIGRRQIDRFRGKNVLDVNHDIPSIKRGLETISSGHFKKSIAGMVNPYGDGKSSTRILDVLASTDISTELLRKRMTF